MRYYLPFLLVFLSLGSAYSQSGCGKSSPLFRFDQHAQPRLYTDTLGRHPQFPFLQHVKGITSVSLFVKAAKDSSSRRDYPVECRAFNNLLKDIGFVRGYKDLKASNIKNTYVNPGTIGNLGYYNKDKEGNGYIYVQLNPAGESIKGVAAWKITGPNGCFLYILHTCGNAFYQNRQTDDCCRAIRAETRINPLEIGPAVADRPVHISIDLYKATIMPSSRKHKRDGKATDTMVSLIRHVDTIGRMHDTAAGRTWKVYATNSSGDLMVCRDTVIQLRPELRLDSGASRPDSLRYIYSDTMYVTLATGGGSMPCQKKWEVAVDGGISYNSIPRFDNTVIHTRTDGAHPVGELAISRIFKPWFQAGVSAAYMNLSYQDDFPYPGAAPNTYSTVHIGKPIIPVQLFAKFTIGGPLKWQSNLTFSAGYAIPGKDAIVNSGNTLSSLPATNGGLTAGIKLGVAYFFSCKFGIGANVSGQYFGNKASTMDSKLIALPVTLGVRYRF